MKRFTLSCLSMALVGFSLNANADFDGGISYDDQRQVGESEVYVPLFHSKGKAGIGSAGGKRIDFDGLSKIPLYTSQIDGIYQSGSRHIGDSDYAYARVANQDVWFGEWSAGGETKNFKDRAVYYVGNDAGTTVPTAGTASYNMVGINKFNGNNKLTGTFNANFGTHSLTGTISNSSLVLSISAFINTSDASFSGSALANGNFGTSQGHFFGANAASLAGFAKFTNRDLDTAFGGTKQ